ncbi:MAG: hypothetical protein DI535_12490 [Citrobacter freundii]|nr:MAG: hypothetical protein DI535_12490 [Citrobacter freundii]
MPDSEFDKQVQEELQGLRLRPSAAVWENVEKEIRRKKRRRVAILFWLVAAIGLLGYSGYRLTQRQETTLAANPVPAAGRPEQQPPASASTNSSTPTDKQPAKSNLPNGALQDQDGAVNSRTDHTTESAPSTPSIVDNNKTADKKSNNTNSNFSHNISPLKQKQQQADITKKHSRNGHSTDPRTVIVNGRTQKQRPGKFPVQKSDSPETEGSLAETNGSAKDPATAVTNNGNEVKPVTPITTDTETTELHKDSAVAQVEKKDSIAEVKAPVVKKQGKTSKIKWALDLAVGASGPIKSPFLLGTEKSNSDRNYSSPANQGGIWGPVPPAGGFGPVYVPRSDIKPGPAARIGVLAEFPVSKRISLSTGLQYQYQSNNIRIGYYKDTSLVFSNYASQMVSVRAVYQGSQQKTFTNRYHYLQVLFNFHWQMNNSKKLPLMLNTGFTAGYLLSSNGLVYDSLQGGIYYHDNNAFNRFQLSFSTGVSFRFNTKGAFQWSVGPEFNMGLRRLVKAEYDKKQYPVFLGVNAKMYLPSRRK